MVSERSDDWRLDFNPKFGMVIEGAPPDHPESEPWTVFSVFPANFPGPPRHFHPRQEERFEVLTGVLDVFLDGDWRELSAGQSITIPAGTHHAVRNSGDEPVQMRNIHTPALGFPAYMATLHALLTSGGIKSLPPKNPRSVILLAMLGCAHERTLISVRPPQRMLRALAFIGKRLGYQLPEPTTGFPATKSPA